MRTSAGIYSKAIRAVAVALCIAALAGCAFRQRYDDSWTRGDMVASWYGPDFHGKLTSSGERYDMDSMTCAHKSFPFGTRLRVTNLSTGQSADVVVNDRGPFVGGRDLDLSRGAAKAVGVIGPGTAKVRVERLGRDERYVKYLAEPVGRLAGPYTVQVGAFADKDNAVHLRMSLELTHQDAHMTEKWMSGKRLYRVRVGKFQNEDDARTLARSLADEGYSVMLATYDPA